MNIKFIIGSFLFLLLLSACTTISNEPKTFKSIDDIREARIGVILGTTQESYVTKELPAAKAVRVENEADAFLALKQGKCDVVAIDQAGIHYAKLKFPEIVEIPSNFAPEEYGIGFNKKNHKLHAQFNAFLKKSRETGLYQEIYDRWIVNGIKGKMPDIKIPTEGEPLRVAVAGIQFPFSFISDDKTVGFDIELSLHFAQYIQRPIEFQTISFGSLIAALQSGKVDMISSAMTITEERQKMVLFSDPYFKTTTALATMPQGSIQNTSFWQSLKNSFYNNLIKENRYLMIIRGVKTTSMISVFSIILGTLLGALICYMRMSKNPWISNFAHAYITLMRGLPVLVLLLMMFYVILADFLIDGVYVAIITFSINFSAYVSVMFQTSIQGVDSGQREAGYALGFTPVQTFYHIIMPQAIKSVLPVYKGEVISLVKMTSIVGYIAVEDITKISDIIRSRTFDAFFPLLVVSVLYFFISWIFIKVIDLLSFGKQFKS